jgi:O-antigen/teichoic acid export membrane protein
VSWRGLLDRAHLRMGSIVVDQGLSSLISFAIAALVARAVSPASFGFFTLLYSVYLVVAGVSRAVVSEPLLIRYPGGMEEWMRQGCRESTGTALAGGIVLGLLGLAAAALLRGEQPLAIAMLAVSMPGLLVKDAWRYCFFATGRPAQAVVNDGLWGAGQLAGIAWLGASGHANLAGMVGIWGLTATACALLGVWQAGLLPRPELAPRWLSRHRDLAPRFATEYLIASGFLQATMWFAGLLGGLVTAGALRAGEIMLGPTRVLMQAAPPAVVPEGARSANQGRRRLLRTAWGASAVLTAAVLAWGGLLLLLLPHLGAHLFGGTWQFARPVLLPMTVGAATNAVSSGPAIGLRILAAAQSSLRVRFVIAPLTTALAVIGVWLGGAQGAAMGIAVGGALGAVVWWVALYRELGRRGAVRGSAAGEAVGAELDQVS